ncbi:MAG TPA: hypothetical protein VFN61_02315, partial [Acidimicrobiales bacterium]|nr:hypothetical protein [Acidimicrobiales bacterium]
FGGLYGDCGNYSGAMASYPESGGTPSYWKVPSSQAGIWEEGGADVLSNGNLLVADGNGANTSTYNGTDGVIELSPNFSSVQYFAPSDWQSLNSGDTDLGSESPAVLPNNQALQVGKDGVGYLISTTNPGGVGAQLYSAQLCSATEDAAFGNTAVNGEIVYVPCSDGITAVSVSGNSWTKLWHTSAGGEGSIVYAGGDLFEQVQNGTVYEVNASNGALLQSISLSAPGAHWPWVEAIGTTLYAMNGQDLVAYSGL